MAGYVYILVNSAFPDLVKIGHTEREPFERATELSGTGVPHPFVVAYYEYVDNPSVIERELHAAFEACRVREAREFFKVRSREVILHLQKLCGQQISKKAHGAEGIYNAIVVPNGSTVYVAGLLHGASMIRVGFTDLSESELRSALSTALNIRLAGLFRFKKGDVS